MRNRFEQFTNEELEGLDGALFAGSVESQISDDLYNSLRTELHEEMQRRGLET